MSADPLVRLAGITKGFVKGKEALERSVALFVLDFLCLDLCDGCAHSERKIRCDH